MRSLLSLTCLSRWLSALQLLMFLLPQVVKAAEDRMLFGLLTLDAAIAVFDLSQQQAVSALALPGDRPLNAPLLSILEQGMRSHVMPLAQCRAQAQAAISSLRYRMPAPV